MKKLVVFIIVILSFTVSAYLLYQCELKHVSKTSAPFYQKDDTAHYMELSPALNGKVDSVYRRILEKDMLFRTLDRMHGVERFNSANALVYGFNSLMNDLRYFDYYAPLTDPRRESIALLLHFYHTQYPFDLHFKP